MIILGIDPGYATVGYGVIEADGMHFRTVDYGAVTTPANTPFDIRLEMIYDGICELCDRYKPDAASVEELFFNTNITTGIAVGHSRGVILLALRKSGVDFYEYTPLQVKAKRCGLRSRGKKAGYDNDKDSFWDLSVCRVRMMRQMHLLLQFVMHILPSHSFLGLM